LTEKIPKSLIDIAGRPFIDHQLALLKKNGIEKVVLCVGFLGEQIEAHVGTGKGWDLDVCCSYDGPDLLGTGGALRKALPLLGDHFFVLYGDSYLPIDYRAVERAYWDARKPGLMTVFKNEGRWDSSNVLFVPEDGGPHGSVEFYSKKERVAGTDHIDYGLGCFAAVLFAEEKRTAFDLADLYSDLAARRQLAAYKVKERFYEVGSFEGIKALSSFLANND
jgi:NDP-sugar pyrophosphorylase family protein